MTKNLALLCCAFMFAGLNLTGCSPTKSNTPPTGITISGAAVDEGAAANTLVGVFATDDADAGDAFTYALVSGTGATDNSSFVIRKDSLFTAVSFDYNVKKTCSIRVETKDRAGAAFDTVLTVTIAHLNHAPIGISLSSASFVDSAAAGTLVARLTAIDHDAADHHTFTLVSGAGSDDDTSFTISHDSLLVKIVPDGSVKHSCAVRIRAQDDSGASVDSAFVITVVHLNRAPTAVSLSNSAIADTFAIGALVGKLAAADKDAGDGHTFTLATGTGSDDNASFLVRNDSLLVNVALRTAGRTSFAVRVQASDDSGATVQQAFVISMAHTHFPPTNIFLSDSVIDEAAPVGSTVGLLSAYDRDSAIAKLRYAVAGGDTDKFEIAYGALNTKVHIPYDSLKHTFSVVIRVVDTLTGGAFQKSFTVYIQKTIVIDGAAIFSERPLSSTSITLSSSMQNTGSYYNWTPYDHFEGIKADQFTLTDSTLSTVSFTSFMPDSFTPYANGKFHVALMGSVPDIGVGIASASTDTNHIYVKATDYGYVNDGKWHDVWIPISVWAPYVDLTAVTMIAGFKCPATPGGTNIIGSIYTVDDIYVTKQ